MPISAAATLHRLRMRLAEGGFEDHERLLLQLSGAGEVIGGHTWHVGFGCTLLDLNQAQALG